MRLPIRSVVFWAKWKKGNKRSRPGVQIAKMNAKTIPQESEIRNIQSSRKNKTKQTQKQKSKRDDNRHERSKTLNRGAGRNVVLAMERDAQWRSNHSRYRRRCQIESKTSFNTATSGDSWYYGAAWGGGVAKSRLL